MSISRPSRYGNPFRIIGTRVVGMEWSDVVEFDHGIGAMPDTDVVYTEAADRRSAVEHAVDLYRQLLAVRRIEWEPARFAKWVGDARGRDLACYCLVTEPCHGDPLLEVANATDIDDGFWRHCSGCGARFTAHGLLSHHSSRFASPACKAAAALIGTRVNVRPCGAPGLPISSESAAQTSSSPGKKATL